MQRRIVSLLALALAATIAVVLVVQVVGRAADGSSTGIAIGRPAPDIRGTTLDGAAFDLASLRGHPVVINFWGPSCVPCVREFPLLKQKLAAHAADGLAIVGVLADDPSEPAKAFAARFGAAWPTVVDPGAALKAAYRVLGRPQTFFVDRSGILRSIQIGELVDTDFERQFGAIAAIAGGS